MEKILKITYFIIFIPTPDFPHFYTMLGGNLGSLLYRDVSMMLMLQYHYTVNAHRLISRDECFQDHFDKPDVFTILSM